MLAREMLHTSDELGAMVPNEAEYRSLHVVVNFRPVNNGVVALQSRYSLSQSLRTSPTSGTVDPDLLVSITVATSSFAA